MSKQDILTDVLPILERAGSVGPEKIFSLVRFDTESTEVTGLVAGGHYGIRSILSTDPSSPFDPNKIPCFRNLPEQANPGIEVGQSLSKTTRPVFSFALLDEGVQFFGLDPNEDIVAIAFISYEKLKEILAGHFSTASINEIMKNKHYENISHIIDSMSDIREINIKDLDPDYI